MKITTSEETRKKIDHYIADTFEDGRTSREEDILNCLDDLNSHDGMLGDDYLLSFDCLCNVCSQQDGTTIASYYSRALEKLIVVNPMFPFSFPSVGDFFEAVIEANDEALTIESQLKAFTGKLEPQS
jgi:hypothetical protein